MPLAHSDQLLHQTPSGEPGEGSTGILRVEVVEQNVQVLIRHRLLGFLNGFLCHRLLFQGGLPQIEQASFTFTSVWVEGAMDAGVSLLLLCIQQPRRQHAANLVVDVPLHHDKGVPLLVVKARSPAFIRRTLGQPLARALALLTGHQFNLAHRPTIFINEALLATGVAFVRSIHLRQSGVTNAVLHQRAQREHRRHESLTPCSGEIDGHLSVVCPVASDIQTAPIARVDAIAVDLRQNGSSLALERLGSEDVTIAFALLGDLSSLLTQLCLLQHSGQKVDQRRVTGSDASWLPLFLGFIQNRKHPVAGFTEIAAVLVKLHQARVEAVK